MKKINVKGLTLSELEGFIVSIGEKKFRAGQLFDALYGKEASSFDEMTTLSKVFREQLKEIAVIESSRLIETQISGRDSTVKYLFELADGKRIESVLIPPRSAFANADPKAEPDEKEEQQRLTLCVSTQVGCALDCKFCATASMGFLRNLTAGEIIDQVMQAKRLSGKKITNLVYMGMGEPLMNYDNVMKSVEIISTAMNIAAKRITISTAGWVPKIRQMADEKRRVKLAVSLHTLDEHARTELMPVNQKYSLRELLTSLEYYYSKVKQRITFEYILFDGWNDRDEDAARLIKLSKTIPSKFNIIPYHSIAFTKPAGIAARLHPASPRRSEEFLEKLRNANLTVFMRSSAGDDIDAACGQLAVKVERGRSISRKPHSQQSKSTTFRSA
jgi:23S rRNA (adenine2503-C2)-methyltransferase